ncbi:MAG TPA: MFS transporter, partial [Dehalococcoidia bacterium]|nr:MFS transporter [Dehalococcoidia bacterium]
MQTVFSRRPDSLPTYAGKYKWLVLLCAALSMGQGSVNISATIISLPDIARDLSLEVALAVWVISGFQLVVTATASSFARLSDMYGREKFFTAGLALYIIASLLCGFSQTGVQLIAARMLLGAAYSISWANATPLVTDAFPPQQRGRALGLAVMAPTSGMMIGLVAGGVLTDWFGWRSVFFMTLPVSGIAFIISLFWLVESGVRVSGQKLDWQGTMLWTSGLVLVLLGLTYVSRAQWDELHTQASFAAGAVLLLAFFLIEPRVRQPMVDLGLFKNRVFASANIASLGGLLGSTTVQLVLTTFYFQGLKHYSPLETAVAVIPPSGAFIVFSPLGGVLADRLGTKLPSLGGLALAAVGLAWLALLDADASYPM